MSEQNLDKHYLNDQGLLVYKHKTNTELFIERPYNWKDSCSMIHEHTKKGEDTVSRQFIDSYRFSTYEFDAWELMTKEEYNSVKSCYKEIHNKPDYTESIEKFLKIADDAKTEKNKLIHKQDYEQAARWRQLERNALFEVYILDPKHPKALSSK